VGRQLPVILDLPDEDLLLQYLRGTGPLRIFESSASSPDDLAVEGFSPEMRGHLFYDLWPSVFPWMPVFAKNVGGEYYIRNKGTAPLLEYSRPPLAGTSPGRLYWANRFCGEPLYNTEDFGRWVDGVWRWVRRTARKPKRGPFSDVWLFPHAYGRLADAVNPGAA